MSAQQCWAPQVFFKSANPQPTFNFLNPQPQIRNWTFKSLVRNRKSATTFRDSSIRNRNFLILEVRNFVILEVRNRKSATSQYLKSALQVRNFL